MIQGTTLQFWWSIVLRFTYYKFSQVVSNYFKGENLLITTKILSCLELYFHSLIRPVESSTTGIKIESRDQEVI